jgi:hypothetical protein
LIISVTAGFVAADLAVVPLRIEGIDARPDVIYAQFLASHLPEPEQAISGWAKELEAGGLLLVEEVDSISTEVAAFDEYLKIVSEVLAQYGNQLFVGARLATTRWDADLWIEVNRATEVRPSTGQAARMFSRAGWTYRFCGDGTDRLAHTPDLPTPERKVVTLIRV